MATTLTPTNANIAKIDELSDYGSDIDDATAVELFSQIDSQPLNNTVLESIEQPIIEHEPLEQHINIPLARLRQNFDSAHKSSGTIETTAGRRKPPIEVEYDESNRRSFTPSNPDERRSAPPEPIPLSDTRSPREKFRSRRPLSVTDLVSPAWCEQQYEYSLSKYGKVRKTPAMKQGSGVHKKLEEQVHVQVPVETVTAEDRFGLRIWNAIQGLRTLRETGLTRELEVWGMLEDEVVIGVIDEITTTPPEAKVLDGAVDEAQSKKDSKRYAVASDQRTLADFLTAAPSGGVLENRKSVLESNDAFLGTLHETPRTYYIVDVKTRQSNTLPAGGSQFRPTQMQLMIYHRLLSSLSKNEVPKAKVFARYNLQPDTTFSDKFIAEIANLDIAAHSSLNEDEIDSAPGRDSLSELLEHNTLSTLWDLMAIEYALTLPKNPSHPPLCPILTVEYRTAFSRSTSPNSASSASGSVIGRLSFSFDADLIDRYISSEMKWWRGERETEGVAVEEANKCRICDFASICVWRATKVEEGIRKGRLKKEGGRRSEV